MDPRQITCAVCGRHVDKTEWWDDPCRAERVLRVYCHGAADEMRLDFARLTSAELDALTVAQGVAFVTPSLPATAPA